MKRAVFQIVLVIILMMPGLAPAHSIQVFAYVENGIIKGEGSLSGGKKVKNGEIKVVTKVGEELLLTTSTDDTGSFSIDPETLGLTQPVDLIIVLDAGPGHRSEWQLTAADFTQSAQDTENPSNQPRATAENNTSRPASPPLKNIVSGIISILGLGALIAWSRSRRGKK